MRFRQIAFLVLCSILFVFPVASQSPNGTINGLVLDPSGGAIAGAAIVIVNDATGVQHLSKTNDEGIYVLPNLPPGPYRLQLSKVGFKTLIKPDIILNVQDALSITFTLPIGAVSETVTVEGGAPLVNTESAAISTVVDRQFAENLPMNGRSFQTLIELTPGVVLTASNHFDSGQFSVNGQRSSSNYWMVDGVGANIGIGMNSQAVPGNGLGGSLGSFSALGGTSSLVSVDALQEFRIQTSSYAPEFGRTPGGQISIVTRSGTNQFHGTVFDYLRNDVFDANNWFNGYTNSPPLPKAKERQNDVGGTFSGPILKNHTFFFFSYEGLRLQLPQTALTTVPDISARNSAVAAMQPYLNAYPLPNGSDNIAAGIANFNASYSTPATLDAYSLRIDHKLTNRWTLFGRYNYSPSEIVQRAQGLYSANTVNPTHITTQTATVGATWLVAPSMTNDFRFNYSRTNAASNYYLDDLGGASPLTSLPFPSPDTPKNGLLIFWILSLQQGALYAGQNAEAVQRQVNVVDSVSLQKGEHNLKFGIDARRLTPVFAPYEYAQDAYLTDVASATDGSLLLSAVVSNRSATFLFRNLGLYAQDTWRIIPRLALTYGVRWDVDFVPQTLKGPDFPAVTGFNLANLSSLAVAPSGASPYHTTYRNLAPRLGVAYNLVQSQNWPTELRGGVGLFYDLASSEAGNNIGLGSYPFGSNTVTFGGSFPLDPAAQSPPPITLASLSSGRLLAFDPNLKLPHTTEWNVAVQQGLGKQQAISASYVGAAGARLLQSALILSPLNSAIGGARLVTNAGTSDYNALQVQFQRRVSRGLQALASYSWAHSIDTASAGSSYGASNALVPSAIASENRGASDFDLRNSFSTGVVYEVPSPTTHTLPGRILGAWSLEAAFQVRSAPPVDVQDEAFSQFGDGALADVRPDVVRGVPFYLYGAIYPGGKALNPLAFTDPPVDPATQNPVRQGTLPRNALRGFGATQVDFAVHRDMSIWESLKLQFRAEVFNVFNHPNFGPPSGGFGAGGFGLSTQMLGASLNNGNVGGGGFSPLYQIGGPRSLQFALKLMF